MLYMVNYDLNKPGQGYSELFSAIEAIGPTFHILKSSWLIETTIGSQEIFNRLSPLIDANDNILVNQLNAGYWGQLPKTAWPWIKERIK